MSARVFTRNSGSAAIALMMLVFAVFAPTAMAQATASSGSIQGTVTDQSGAAVPGALIAIANPATGQTVKLVSSSTGAYSTGPLQPGNYVVRVQAKGFSTASLPLVVQVGTTSSGNVKLAIGQQSEVIEVQSAVERVNTEQTTVQGVITGQQIDQLPINGRNFLDAAQLEPGVQIQDGGNFDPTKNGFTAISVGGRAGRTTRIEVDGIDISDETVGTTTQNIPQDAIQEFQIGQSSLDISSELTSSGAVNVATRSGSNQWHGDTFYDFRHHSLNARLPGGVDSPFQRQQYGGRLGGPILKDKLFFFLTGERTQQALAQPVQPFGPFASLTGSYNSPFRSKNLLGRLDYELPKGAHLFYRFTYDNNLNTASYVANVFQPFQNQNNTPAHVVGFDFNTGSFTHAIRFGYSKFQNHIGDAVTGSNIVDPAPGVDINIGSDPICLTGGADAFCSGPNFLAPQATFQQNTQIKYDGSKIWRSHIFRYGVGFNRIRGGGLANFLGVAPAINSAVGDTLPNGGSASDPLNYPVDLILLGNGQGFFTETPAFGYPGGGQHDNRFQFYVGDTWKLKPNLSVNFGLRYVHDTGRVDSDLAPIPCSQLNPALGTCSGNLLDQWLPGLGNRVRNPKSNFGPQIGIAWDPQKNGKMVIRAGAGVYYENIVFNSSLFDRPGKLAKGLFNGTAQLCGGQGTLTLPDGTAVTSINGKDIATQICGQTIGSVSNDIIALQKLFQQATATAGAQSNGVFIGNTLAAGTALGTSVFAPNYSTPRSLQMNFGIQRELRPGLVFSADYIRNVGLHYLQSIDVNHVGDARYFNANAAANAINATNAAFGCGTGSAGIDCAIESGAKISDYQGNGLDSGIGPFSGLPAVAFGATPDTGVAFPGQNPNLGQLLVNYPSGRSVYNGLQLSLKASSIKNPVKGVVNSSLQVSYALSSFKSQNGDQDFINNANDFANTQKYFGNSALDRTHQLSFGGVIELPAHVRLGLTAHFNSPLSRTLYLPGGSIFTSDITGDGTGSGDPRVNQGDILPGTNLGSFSHGVNSVGKLNSLISSFNSAYAGKLTPAGQAVVSAGLISASQLAQLGGVIQSINSAPSNQATLGWQKDAALRLSWIYKIRERVEIEPSASFYNVFNFSNFDAPNNALSGVLDGSQGSLNGTSNTIAGKASNRVGPGSGVFASGAPRQLEFGMKISF